MVTPPGRRPAAVLAAVWLVLIALATLQPTQSVVVTPTFCIFRGPVGGMDFVLNVVLFAPLGMALRWATGRWNVAVMAGVLTTLFIEVLQSRLIPGRDASLGDLLANTLGTLLGAWIAVELFRWVNASGVAARRYASIFGIIIAAVVLASAWLLQPFPTRFWQLVRWTPQPPNMDKFQGQVFAAELNGRFIPDGVLVATPEMYDSLSRTMTMRATLGANPPSTRRPAVIVRIANYLDEGFALSQRGRQVTFRTH
ncbi:MAG: VanZ family protein, partial [Vicinamibacterales bacterium]